MNLNEEYKKYFLEILEEYHKKLVDNNFRTEGLLIMRENKIQYLQLRINNIKNDNPEFDHGYEPTNEWDDFKGLSDRILGYNDWLNERRRRGIDSVCES